MNMAVRQRRTSRDNFSLVSQQQKLPQTVAHVVWQQSFTFPKTLWRYWQNITETKTNITNEKITFDIAGDEGKLRHVKIGASSCSKVWKLSYDSYEYFGRYVYIRISE